MDAAACQFAYVGAVDGVHLIERYFFLGEELAEVAELADDAGVFPVDVGDVPRRLHASGKMAIQDTDFTDDWAKADLDAARRAAWRAVLAGDHWTDLRINPNPFAATSPAWWRVTPYLGLAATRSAALPARSAARRG